MMEKPTLVDARGLMCPMPLLRLRLALNRLKSGDRLTIYADDPTFEYEFATFCKWSSITQLTKKESVGFMTYTIEVK